MHFTCPVEGQAIGRICWTTALGQRPHTLPVQPLYKVKVSAITLTEHRPTIQILREILPTFRIYTEARDKGQAKGKGKAKGTTTPETEVIILGLQNSEPKSTPLYSTFKGFFSSLKNNSFLILVWNKYGKKDPNSNHLFSSLFIYLLENIVSPTLITLSINRT